MESRAEGQSTALQTGYGKQRGGPVYSSADWLWKAEGRASLQLCRLAMESRGEDQSTALQTGYGKQRGGPVYSSADWLWKAEGRTSLQLCRLAMESRGEDQSTALENGWKKKVEQPSPLALSNFHTTEIFGLFDWRNQKIEFRATQLLGPRTGEIQGDSGLEHKPHTNLQGTPGKLT
ncbi:hypothetical protein STEG23_037937 [Scotinomys teguina]